MVHVDKKQGSYIDIPKAAITSMQDLPTSVQQATVARYNFAKYNRGYRYGHKIFKAFIIPYGDWKYAKPIIIRENSGKDLRDYQVKIDLNSRNFDFSKANPDGSDIRFFSPIVYNLYKTAGKLSYWIEKWDSVNKQATIWVKVPYIPANGQTTIYMYYGNPSAPSESNGFATFELFDDFEDGDYTTNPHWTPNTNLWSVVLKDTFMLKSYYSGAVSGTTDPNWIRADVDLRTQGYWAEVKHKQYHDVATYPTQQTAQIGFMNSANEFQIHITTPDNSEFRLYVGTTYVSQALSLDADVYYWFRLKFVCNGNFCQATATIQDEFGNSWTLTHEGQINAPDGILRFFIRSRGYYGQSVHQYWDNVHVSKYTSPEPTTSVGAEEVL